MLIFVMFKFEVNPHQIFHHKNGQGFVVDPQVWQSISVQTTVPLCTSPRKYVFKGNTVF
jgi:hypothetical protein